MTAAAARAPEVLPDDVVLRVTDLAVSAGTVPLVTGVSFEIGRQERVGLIGASGSGKTLTCMAVAGLLPDGLRAAGDVRLTDSGINLLTASQRTLAGIRGLRTGMVFQEPMTALNPTMTVGKQVDEVMLRHRTRPSKRAARAATLDLLAAVDLPDPERLVRSYPHQLSGGQRQRVVLSIALANNPDLLICDEPTTALDVTVQATVLQLIAERTAAVESALLFVTHDLAVVAAVCDRLLVMYGGRIVEQGDVVDVLADPQHPHTRQLLADAELGTVDGPGES
jgi:peptide/nickel transport system ATP-binding protein